VPFLLHPERNRTFKQEKEITRLPEEEDSTTDWETVLDAAFRFCGVSEENDSVFYRFSISS
jgi:hypothetical protein